MKILPIICAFLLVATTAFSKDVVTEDFDDGAWGSFSENYCYYDYSCTVVDSALGKPGKSFLATFFASDCTGDRPTKGPEMAVSPLQGTCYNDDCHIWMGTKLYYNKHFGKAGNDHIIFQYHAVPVTGSAQFSLYYESGTDNLTVATRHCQDPNQNDNSCAAQYAPTGYKPIEHAGIAPLPYDEWIDVVMEVQLSVFDQDGIIRVWVNGALEYEVTGEYIGLNRSQVGYWKLGNYCFSCDCNESSPKQLQFDDMAFCAHAEGDTPCEYSDVMPAGGSIPAGES